MILSAARPGTGRKEHGTFTYKERFYHTTLPMISQIESIRKKHNMLEIV